MNSNDTDARVLLRPSKLQQYAACPGSYQMQLGMPDEPSPEAEEGTLLHAAVATGDADGLDSEQSDLVRQCTEYLAALVERTGLDHVTYEQPLTIRDSYGEEITHGTADIVAISPDHPDRCAVVDWKFGRVPVEATATNLQLAAYALGAMQLSGAASCEAHVFQPRIGRHVCHVFAASDAIQRNLRAIYVACTAEALVLNPGEEQCRYCKAKAICPAFRKTCDSLAIARDNADALATPETLADLYSRAKVAKKFATAIEAAMKKYLNEHGECCGYRYKEVAGDRECTDIAGLHGAVDGVISPSEFLDCCTVSIASLEEAFVEKLCATAAVSGGKITKKDAKAKFAEMTERFVGRGKSSLRIERKED